ncbi:MAG TPA: DsbA family protein [Candidatus Binatia bacterium]|jgi:2-hydroxychromene-2-carboxylate isomerase
MRLAVYIDYKSPYAYLAKDPVYELARETGVEIDWLPYTLDIPAYLGSATLDEHGAVVEESRNAHQWRRVRYAYMDARREAAGRGLTIRGPRKIFDSTLAGIGMLYAKRHGAFRPYNDLVFARFWTRELDIEDRAAMTAVLRDVGAEVSGLDAFVEGEGRAELRRIQEEAERAGVFGVPSFVLESGELFWGREHLPRLHEILKQA